MKYFEYEIFCKRKYQNTNETKMLVKDKNNF